VKKIIVVALLMVTLNNIALFTHYNHANKVYEKCYIQNFDSLSYENDLNLCMKKDTMFRILGTILFTEGSYLEDIK
jgi:hypothetical protein